MKLIVNRHKILKIVIFLLVTICFSNCTVFRYVYVRPQFWWILIVLTICLTSLKIMKDGNSIKIYTIFLGFILISYFLSNYKPEMQKYIWVMILIFVLYSVKFSEDDLSFFLKLCGWFSTFIACTIIIEYFFNNFCTTYLWFLGTPYPFERASLIAQKNAELAIQAYSGVAYEKADAGYYMVIGIVVRLSNAFAQKKLKHTDFLLIILYLIAIILSGKRMLLLCAALIIFIMFLISQEKNKILKILKWTAILFICLFLISRVPIVEHMINRFLSAASGDDGALLERYVKWNYAFLLFEIKPFIGHGFGTYNEAAVQVGYAASFFAHNIYIELLADCGIVGTLLFIALAVYNLWAAFDLCYLKRNILTVVELKLILFSLAMQILILIYGISGNTIFYVFQLVMYMFCFVITSQVRRNIKKIILQL